MKINYFCFIYCDPETSMSIDYDSDTNKGQRPTREFVINQLEYRRLCAKQAIHGLSQCVEKLKTAYLDREKEYDIPFLRDIQNEVEHFKRALVTIDTLLAADKLYFKCDIERVILKDEVL